jgi:hypothetical protein
VPADVLTKSYAVIILGLALHINRDDIWNDLINVIDHSAITLIEYSLEYKKAKNQYKMISKLTKKQSIYTEDMDLSDICTQQSSSSDEHAYPYRRFVIFA